MIIDVKNKNGNKLERAFNTINNMNLDEFLDLKNDLMSNPMEKINFDFEEDDDDIKFSDYLSYFNKKINETENSVSKYYNVIKLMYLRDLDAYSSAIKEEYDLVFSNIIFYNAIKILEDEQYRKKFIDFENNRTDFEVKFGNGEVQPMSKSQDGYIRILASMFGKVNEDGTFECDKNNSLYNNFYIEDIDKYKEAYSELYNELNIEKFVPKENRFKKKFIEEDVSNLFRIYDEPDWNVNEQLKENIIGDMPHDLTDEDKIVYIYSKMCKTLLYDERYTLREKMNNNTYTSDFNKEHIENIKPGDKITCFDFSRIAVKLIDETTKDTDAVVIIEGVNKGHFEVGVSTLKGVATLEAINIMESGESTSKVNDLLRAKIGTQLQGIKQIEGEDGVFENSLNKVYPMVLGSNVKTETEILMEQLKSLPENNININLETKLQNTIKSARKVGISGNEFTLFYNSALRSEHFGKKGVDVDSSYLVEREKNKEDVFNRIICLRDLRCKDVYMININSLELSCDSIENIEKKLENGELEYERENKKLIKDGEHTDD